MLELSARTDRRREPFAVPNHLRIHAQEAIADHLLKLFARHRDLFVAEQAIHDWQIEIVGQDADAGARKDCAFGSLPIGLAAANCNGCGHSCEIVVTR